MTGVSPGWFVVELLVSLAAAYLCGSVNYAIIVTRLVSGQDIRELGNRNPGTANVARSIGKGWAAVVFFADLFKGLLPVLLARRAVFPDGGALQTLALAAVGIAAIAGHCRPVFFGFRGGGGIATAVGVYLFFIPAELIISMLAGFAAVMLFVRRVRFRLGRWIPIIFVATAPVLTLVLSLLVRVPLPGGISIGGHAWPVVAAVFAISLFLIAMNRRLLAGTFREYGDTHAPET
ncbi:MAG: glycerol-3-phosphate acyltransferase [Spirochaetales bacterium]|nr:glycerol-3-phosphate acyltransferase [Spirochaetales bacterium]